MDRDRHESVAILRRLQAMSPAEWLPRPQSSTIIRVVRGAYHTNYIVECAGKLSVARTCRTSQWGNSPGDQLAKEFATLIDVSPSGVTPNPLKFFGGPQQFLVESLVEGVPFQYTEESLSAVGRGIAAVHRLPIQTSSNHLSAAAPDAFLLDDGKKWLDKAEALTHARSTTSYLREAQLRLHPLHSRWTLGIIHTDLIATNIVSKGGNVWFLDWEGARIGPAAWDLAYFTSPITTQWAPGRPLLGSDEQGAIFMAYSRAAGVDSAVVADEVHQLMPFVVFRALCWCVGFEAERGLSDEQAANLAWFTNPEFVREVIGGVF